MTHRPNSRRARTTVALLAAAAALLVLPALTAATVRINRGMAGVRIGMTQAQVKHVLGTPSFIKHSHNDFGAYTEFAYPHRIKADFQGNTRMTSITTSGRSERTTAGVGVGSTRSDVLAKVAHVSCDSRLCTVGELRAGHHVTTFFLSRRSLVSRVSVGVVLD